MVQGFYPPVSPRKRGEGVWCKFLPPCVPPRKRGEGVMNFPPSHLLVFPFSLFRDYLRICHLPPLWGFRVS